MQRHPVQQQKTGGRQASRSSARAKKKWFFSRTLQPLNPHPRIYSRELAKARRDFPAFIREKIAATIQHVRGIDNQSGILFYDVTTYVISRTSLSGHEKKIIAKKMSFLGRLLAGGAKVAKNGAIPLSLQKEILEETLEQFKDPRFLRLFGKREQERLRTQQAVCTVLLKRVNAPIKNNGKDALRAYSPELIKIAITNNNAMMHAILGARWKPLNALYTYALRTCMREYARVQGKKKKGNFS